MPQMKDIAMTFAEKQQHSQRSVMGEIVDLPQMLLPGTVATLLEGAKLLAIAVGERVTIYRLLLESKRSPACEVSSHRLPGQVSAIAESIVGVVIASEVSERSTVSLLQEKELTTILELTGKIM